MSDGKKPYVVGITGGIASGKSAVGKILGDEGVPVLDTDHICHELLDTPNPAYTKVIERFGADLVAVTGGPIDRARLRERVMTDAKAKCDLEAILHPEIMRVTAERIAALKDADLVAVQVPLLFEAGLADRYNEVWCILVDHKAQLERLKSRNGLTDEQATVLIKAQWPQEKKAARSHRIIDNSGSLDETKAQVLDCLKKARAEAAKNLPAPTPAAPHRHEEYRKILKRFAGLATAETLERMGGNLADARHKNAEANLVMHVKSNEPGKPDADEHLLKVHMRMCVENKRSKEPSTCDCRESQCSCPAPQPDGGCQGCGKGNCQGCGKGKPPVPPAPACRGGNSGNGALLAFLAFLAFLFAAGLIAALVWLAPWKDQPQCEKPGTTCEKPVEHKPIVVLTDEQFDKLFCKSKCKPENPTPPPTPVPPTPPSPPCTSCPPPVVPPTPPATCGEDFASPSATPPAFIHRYLHNQVKARVTVWSVAKRAGNEGVVVTGIDNEGRLVNHMEFGPACRFDFQWIVNYGNSGNTLWVDRFEAPNVFVGRTVFEYDRWGQIANVTREDGYRRVVISAVFERNQDGSLCKVVVRRFATSGQVIDVKVSWYRPDAAVMLANFYLYEKYGQYK